MLRRHQIAMGEAIDGIIAGSGIKTIIVKACPGSGKSSLPILAGKLITAGLADKLFWICPRMSLQDQAERNFLDPLFRQMFGHRLSIRSSTNDHDPSRSLDGAVSTYQALGVDAGQTALNDFLRHRYILVLDEYHHAEESGEWTKAIFPLYQHAAFRVLMSGTLSRGDKKKIAFTPYRQAGDSFFPVLEGNRETKVIEYTRRDALDDKAVIPLEFVFTDGLSKWEKTGRDFEAKISTRDPREASYALYTALHTEYATELLREAVGHWHRHRVTKNGHAQLLVVSADIERAKEYTEQLRGMGVTARIATSDDGPEALKAIKDFKAGKFGALTTCQIAYEGLDCPSISHIACLTRIRTAEWIEQCVCRANRIDPHGGPYEDQRGYIFAPHDQAFLEIARKIEADQVSPAESKKGGNGHKEAPPETDLFGIPVTPGGITPLSSKILDREATIPPFPASEVMTPREREADLLGKIESYIRNYAFQARFNPKRLNAEVRAWAGKSRQEMTIAELEACWRHVQQTYPLSRIRGTGHPRVATRAVPYGCRWKQD